jgi:small subunit ribosomal protein S17
MKVFTGIVIRTSDKTAKVAVTRVVAHPIYKKRIKRVTNFLVHDEIGVEVGAQVQFIDSKPYSKMKRWKIVTGKEGNKQKSEKGKAKSAKVSTRKNVEKKVSVNKTVEKKGTKK